MKIHRPDAIGRLVKLLKVGAPPRVTADWEPQVRPPSRRGRCRGFHSPKRRPTLCIKFRISRVWSSPPPVYAELWSWKIKCLLKWWRTCIVLICKTDSKLNSLHRAFLLIWIAEFQNSRHAGYGAIAYTGQWSSCHPWPMPTGSQ